MLQEYIAVKENSYNFNCIAFSIGYSKGYTPERRGYYLYVQPMKRSTQNGFVKEEYMPFDGKTYRLNKVSRSSKKAEAEAEKIAINNKDWILKEFTEKFGLEIEV